MRTFLDNNWLGDLDTDPLYIGTGRLIALERHGVDSQQYLLGKCAWTIDCELSVGARATRPMCARRPVIIATNHGIFTGFVVSIKNESGASQLTIRE